MSVSKLEAGSPKELNTVRVREEIWENQRWKPHTGFTDQLLPSDRFSFSNENGAEPRDKDLINLSSTQWELTGDWELENHFKGRELNEGWTYATGFRRPYSAKNRWKSVVRRRKWFRVREYDGLKPWCLLHTKLVLRCQINTGSGEECAWGLSLDGHIYYRKQSLHSPPEESQWTKVLGVKNVCQLTMSGNGTPFVVTTNGSLQYRKGTIWVTGQGPPGELIQVAPGKNILLALTGDQKCWALTQNLENILEDTGNCWTKPLEWFEVRGNVKNLYVSKTEDIMALANLKPDDGGSHFTRLTKEDLHGPQWENVFSLNGLPLQIIPTNSMEKVEKNKSFENLNLAPEFVSTGKATDLKVHYKLCKGFIVGSQICLDIVIPMDAKLFQLNFTANTGQLTAFQFKVKCKKKVVICNGQDADGNWGGEDGNAGRGGVKNSSCFQSSPKFQFKRGRKITIKISCEAAHFIVSGTGKSDFAYYYGHRCPPEKITHFTVLGSVSIIAIGYIMAGKNCGKNFEFLINPGLGQCGTSDSVTVFSSRIEEKSDFPEEIFDIPSNLFEIQGQGQLPSDNWVTEGQSSDLRHYLYMTAVCEIRRNFTMAKTRDLLTVLANKEELVMLENDVRSQRSPSAIDLDKWLVFVRLQCEYPWKAKLFSYFSVSLATVLGHFETKDLSDNEIAKFWLSCDRLVDISVWIAGHIYHQLLLNPGWVGTVTVDQAEAEWIEPICQMLSLLGDSLSRVLKQYLLHKLGQGLFVGAVDFMNTCTKNELSNHKYLVAVTNVGQQLVTAFRTYYKWFGGLLQSLEGVNYFEVIYRAYDQKYYKLVEPLIKKMAANLKPVDTELVNETDFDKDALAVRNEQFLLYLRVKEFASPKAGNLNTSSVFLKIPPNYHLWFQPCVPQWLDTALCEAKIFIRKAVRHPDNEIEHHDTQIQFKFTAAAYDTYCIFHQIYIDKFWKHLSWPDVKTEFNFVCRILEDFKKCTVYYVQLHSQKFEDKNNNHRDLLPSHITPEIENKKFSELSNYVCHLVIDLNYLGEELNSIVSKLGIDQILSQLEVQENSEAAKEYKMNFETVLESVTEEINVQIKSILNKMEPVICSLIQTAVSSGKAKDLDMRLKYFFTFMRKFEGNLTVENFELTNELISQMTLKELNGLIVTHMEKKSKPDIFKRIEAILDELSILFFAGNKPKGTKVSENENGSKSYFSLGKVRDILEIQKASTCELILKFSREQLKSQAHIKDKGQVPMISIRAAYMEDCENLRVEILNCRRLKTQKQRTDPYVKVKLILSNGLKIPAKKTRVVKETDCPLFDETLNIQFPADLMSLNGLISFQVFNDNKLIGRDELLGEGLLPLESIPSIIAPEFPHLPQQHLPLNSKMGTQETEATALILNVLQNRPWDAKAVKFVKQQKLKAPIQ